MKKKSVLERIGIFLFSVIVANLLVAITPSIPDEMIVLAFGIYEALKG